MEENLNQKSSFQTSQTTYNETGETKKKKCRCFRLLACCKFLFCLILIVLVACLIFNFYFAGLRGEKKSWQAIFLTNGQVYFGKIIRETKGILVLKEVYYLQVTPVDKESESQPQLSVIKLGQEPHGPTDEMRINKEHILFVEDLKPDSEVAKTIEEYKKGK